MTKTAHEILLKAAVLAAAGECWPAYLSKAESAEIEDYWWLMVAEPQDVRNYGGFFEPHERCVSLCFAAAMAAP
jgi:hypothetical protein